MTLRRERVTAACDGAAGVVVVCSENPLRDTGGGQRSAQLTTQFLARDQAVVFVHRGVTTESVDLGLVFEHPRVVEVSLADFVADASRDAVAALFARDDVTVLSQVAVAECAAVLERARAAGAVTIYDCVDRWASEMGRGWFDADVERRVARGSELLTASAPELVRHVERLTERHTHLVSNGFDSDLFRTNAEHERPADLPTDGRIVLFVGALWGSWLDWGLVRDIATAMPDEHFVFIGDRKREGGRLPANCTFLGLKPLTALPPYHAHADVAVVPWRVDDTTNAMSPLTVYEYVASGLPVVASPTDPLRGIPGIVSATRADEFVAALRSHGRSTLSPDVRTEMSAFAVDNDWSRRADTLLDLAAEARARPTRSNGARGPAPRRSASVSVVIPSYNHERFIGAAVDSVRDQTLPVGDLVVIDDGSRDGSLDVLAAHAFPAMRTLAHANIGAHATINRAITISEGDWIAVLNSDDVYEPEWIEAAWGVARDQNAALVFGTVSLIDTEGRPLAADHDVSTWYAAALERAAKAGTLTRALVSDNIAMTTSNFFLHKELWRRLGGFGDYRYVHDLDFLLRALRLCPDRVVHARELYGVRYRIHESNTIAESTERALAERATMLRTVNDPIRRIRTKLRRGRDRSAVARSLGGALLAPVVEPAAPTKDALTVGLVVKSLSAGGLEELVAVLAEALRVEGLRVSVLCTHEGGAVADRLRASGVSVTLGGGRPAGWRSWLDANRPDVLSTHFIEPSVVEVLHDHGAPIVETVHNTYAWFAPENWAAEVAKGGLLDATVAVSERVRTYYRQHCPDAPDPIVVPNSVHPARAALVPRAYARRRIGLAVDRPLFVHLGRVTSQKNLPGLLDAFADLVDTVPASRLLLVGPTEGRGLAELRRTHADLFRDRQVRHVSPVNVVGPLLSAADAYVSSSFYEGWSVAASEALWVGRPVLLSDCGSAKELVGPDGARGRLVPNPLGDPMSASPERVARPEPAAMAAHRSAMADAMLEVAEAPESWRGRDAAIRAHARPLLSPSRMGADYAKVLRDVVARRREIS